MNAIRCMRWMLFVLGAAAFTSCGSNSTGNDGNNTQPVAISGSIVVPSEWAGMWEVRVTFRDCTTNAIHSVEVVKSQVCPGDTLANPFVSVLDGCTGTRTGNHIAVNCDYAKTVGACQVALSVDFSMDVSGNSLSGTGRVESTATPACGAIFTPGCEKIEISGTRLSTLTAGCDTLTTSHRRSFVR